jgi:hypothetical protein
MANFFIPSNEDASRFANTMDGGFLHPWKVAIVPGDKEYVVVGLKGGFDKTDPLTVASNNPGIVRVSESQRIPHSPGAWPSEDRLFTIVGQRYGTTMLEARGAVGPPWCSLQIEVAGGFSSEADLKSPFVVTNTWEFGFEKDLNPLGYNLPNGVRIPLPPRGRSWPQRETTMRVKRATNSAQQVIYYVTLTPVGHDAYWVQKWLVEQIADKGIEKVVALWVGGGAVLAAAAISSAIATVFIPNDGAADSIWEGKTVEGPVYGVSIGFNN